MFLGLRPIRELLLSNKYVSRTQNPRRRTHSNKPPTQAQIATQPFSTSLAAPTHHGTCSRATTVQNRSSAANRALWASIRSMANQAASASLAIRSFLLPYSRRWSHRSELPRPHQLHPWELEVPMPRRLLGRPQKRTPVSCHPVSLMVTAAATVELLRLAQAILTAGVNQ